MNHPQDHYGDLPTGGSMRLEPGMPLDIYRLEEPLGRGGMGLVWKAWDTEGNRLVAIKLLPPEFNGNAAAIEQVREAFQVVHALTHQHIGKTIGLYVDKRHGPYIVLEYLPGMPLTQFVRKYRQPDGTLPLELVVKLLRPVAAALDYGHAEGVLHRDVKPDNILVEDKAGEPGKVWLIDYGLAAEIRSTAVTHTNGTVDTRGTRPYMASEQYRGKRHLWDGRTDQYALAVIAYELLAGRRPFDADDELALMYATMQEELDPIERFSAAMNAQLAKALAKAKGERFESCLAFLAALEANASVAAPWIEIKSEPVAHPLIVAPPLMKAPFETQAAKAGQVAWAQSLGVPVVEMKGVGIELTLIPPGEFLMGSSDADVAAALAADANLKTEYMIAERPQHAVRLTHPFWMGTYPVLQGEFQQVMGRNPSHFSPSGDGKANVERVDSWRLPVEHVSWFDAVEFCNQLSVREQLAPYYAISNVQRVGGAIKSADVKVSGGKGYRLPTEAEWEYACRAGTTSPYHFGSVNIGEEANVDGNSPFGTTTKGPYLQRTSVVGSYAPNGFGLYDMHGNVWEWCGDWYDAGFYSQTNGTAIDPFNANPAVSRVLRGGSWDLYAGYARAAYRVRSAPGGRSGDRGFRLARTE